MEVERANMWQPSSQAERHGLGLRRGTWRAVAAFLLVAGAFAGIKCYGADQGLAPMSSRLDPHMTRERAVSKRRRMMAADLDDGKLAVLTGHDDDDNADASSQRASGAQESTSRILRDAEGSALLPFDSSQSPRDSPQETPQEAPPGGTSPPQTKVALAFFGLTRSLKFTIDSIRQNVLAPLDEAAIEYDIYLHSYDLESITNSRSAEIGQSLNTTEWKLLDPDFVSITDQDEFKREFKPSLDACHSQGDPYDDGFASLTNLFCQLNSLRIVTGMWRAQRANYDAVLYLRPDVLYNCPLPVDAIRNLKQNTLYIPDFHHFKGYNDRFVLGSPMAAANWGDRLHFTLATCMQQPVHPEHNVKLLAEHYELDVEMVDFNFYRVRSDGLVEPTDLEGRYALPQCEPAMFAPFRRREDALDNVTKKRRRWKINKIPPAPQGE